MSKLWFSSFIPSIRFCKSFFYKFDDFFFDWKFEWKSVYTKVIFHISVYETLLRILNKLFENSYWVDDGYSFENFATSTITYVRKLIM